MISVPASAQLIKNLDEVSNFNEGLASVRKGDQWAFIDQEGNMVIDFRDDLVVKTDQNGKVSPPQFNDERALIFRMIDDIKFYGYIDRKGSIVIDAKYVNATNFKNGKAIVMQFNKEVVGQNKLLGKDVVSYEVEEYVIDKNDKALTPALHARNCVPDKVKSGKAPMLTTQFFGDHLVAVKTSEQKWEIYDF